MVEDYTTPTPKGGRARVRIYQTNAFALPVVLCTEPADNPGMSITNAAEVIAAEVLTNHPELFGAGYVEARPFTWVEHYREGARGTPHDRATFDLVEFAHYEVRDVSRAGVWAKEIGSPSWKPLDRESVEALIGGPID